MRYSFCICKDNVVYFGHYSLNSTNCTLVNLGVRGSLNALSAAKHTAKRNRREDITSQIISLFQQKQLITSLSGSSSHRTVRALQHKAGYSD